MKKKLRVVEIRGFRGLLLAAAIGCCLFAGFIVFPGYVAMSIWNYVSVKTMMFPSVGLMQGVLLWGIVLVSYMIIRKRNFSIAFKTPNELSKDELDEVMAKIKTDATARMMSEIISQARVEKAPPALDGINTDNVDKTVVGDEIEISNKNIDN